MVYYIINVTVVTNETFVADLINFVDKECKQQSNGYDCGVHVICNTERLAEYTRSHQEISSCDMMVRINTSAKREEIISIIQNLASAS